VCVGRLSPFSMQMLRDIKQFFGVTFKIRPDPETTTVTYVLTPRVSLTLCCCRAVTGLVHPCTTFCHPWIPWLHSLYLFSRRHLGHCLNANIPQAIVRRRWSHQPE